jgi:beta-lactamase class A
VKNTHWKKYLLYGGISLAVIFLLVQFFYPWSNTALGARVDGLAVGGKSKEEALAIVSEANKKAPLEIYFGDGKAPYLTPSQQDLKTTTHSDDAVSGVMYPWWLRIIPTSIFWAGAALGDHSSKIEQHEDAVTAYLQQELGDTCQIKPRDAGIKNSNDKLTLDPAQSGGECNMNDAVRSIMGGVPSPRGTGTVRVAMKAVAPNIGNDVAETLIQTIESQLKNDTIELKYNDKKFTLDTKNVRAWLTFSPNDKGGLATKINTDEAAETLKILLEPVVNKPAGDVTITTSNFTEVSRKGGGDGASLNIGGTEDAIVAYLLKQKPDIAVAATVIPSRKTYVRSYSADDTGLSALMKNFADTHPGVYGVSMIELSGKHRRASYNDTKNFFPASTYKLFVAYSVLKRIESGQFAWSDQIQGGRDLAKCFDDMIVLSDNACAETLTLKVGYSGLNADIRALGLTRTKYVGPGVHQATAGDLSVFMGMIESGQLPINASNRALFISTLKRNVYRQGIPAGASGAVADKVGFIDALLHDSAIVYSPSGTYVLAIMTDGSSWANIAQLTREIEALRNQ